VHELSLHFPSVFSCFEKDAETKNCKSILLFMRESDLYKPVARLLERRYGCARKNTWTAGSGKDLSFLAGFGKRKPDVVTCKDHPLRPEVHLAEGKLLSIPTHGFEETLNQLDSFRPYADFLWAVFPSDRWASASTNHDRWTVQLRQRGYGLFLVDNGRAKLELGAFQNSGVDSLLKNSVLAALLGASDDPVSIPTLATETAETAIRAVARIVKIMSGPVRDRVGEHKKPRTFTAAVTDPRGRYCLIGEVPFDRGRRFIEGDPFSCYLNDGRALVWVWRQCGTLRNDEKSIQAIVSRTHASEVYFLADNGNWEWVCRPLAELSIAHLKAAGYVEQFNLGRAIAISGRSLKGISDDLRRLIAWARER
jgi:hypothetical protein